MKAADFKMLQDLLLTGIEIQKVRGEKKKKKKNLICTSWDVLLSQKKLGKAITFP